MAALSEFGLRRGCGDMVRALIKDMQFIYPTAQNVSKAHKHNMLLIAVQGEPLVGSPYENLAILLVIKYELFCVKSITQCYPKQFEDKREVPPSVLAFTATVVRSPLLNPPYYALH